MNEKKRIWELDFIRGFCIALMVFDHLMLNLAFYFASEWFPQISIKATDGQLSTGAFEIIRALSSGAIIEGSGLLKLCWFAKWYWYCDLRTVIHPFIFCIFIALCGISCSFSRNNMKRGVILALVAYGFTLFTGLLLTEDIIRFGVLNLLTIGILSWQTVFALSGSNKKKMSYISLGIAVLLLTVSLIIRNSDAFLSSVRPDSPAFIQALVYTADAPAFDASKHYNNASFSPGDFFPVFPWISVFFFGAGFGPLIYPHKKSLLPSLDGKWNKPANFLGRHTLVIYVAHQPVLFILLMLISYFIVTPGNWILF